MYTRLCGNEVNGIDRCNSGVARIVQHGVDHGRRETIDHQSAFSLACSRHGSTGHDGRIDGGLYPRGNGFGIDSRRFGNRAGNLVARLRRHSVVRQARGSNRNAVDDHIAGIHLVQAG